MHQYSRPPPTTASPATADQTNPTRTNNPRDREVRALREASTQGSGSSEDFQPNTKQESSLDNPTAQMQRLNQVIQNFHTKAALIILHSRVDLPEAYSSKSNEKRVNRWFNIEVDETDEYNEDIRRWRKCDVKIDRPPPLVIEIYLTTDQLAQGQRLVILDEEERRCDVATALSSTADSRSKRKHTESNEVLLERWTIELGNPSSGIPSDLTSVLPLVYKKSIVLFRSLYTYCNFLPAWKLCRKAGKGRGHMSMKLGYRIVDGTRLGGLSRPDNLEAPLCDSTAAVTSTYSFGETDSPAGRFSVEVKYRENCDFRIDDAEELLSSRFLGTDDEIFRPSLPSENNGRTERESSKIGSLPNDQRQHLRERPELGHAYGSLSTFHQAGFSPGTSPISALRSARELSQASPSPESVRPAAPLQSSPQRASLRAPTAGRRSSFSIQPFKAPALSASPLGASPLASSPRTSVGRVPALGSLTEERTQPSPNAPAAAARKSGSLVSENAISSSPSSSPRPAPVKYSSSFSHRRARLSVDRTKAIEEDQTSSGKASATSSAAPPGSGLLADNAAGGGGSSGSMQEDDENISDFLKMLDLKKDLLSPNDASAGDASARRTAAALNKFHRMRDSNAALSESMSSSLLVPRPSQPSSRHASGVPPMMAATSGSSASSPGKPISPHTPHTPFAPSRLSAAYSHDDATEEQQQFSIEEDARSPDNTSASDETAQDRSAAQVPAIDIPNSPRPFLPAYRRSSSAQRRPISSDDDIGDLYGMRSASMGAPERKTSRTERVSHGGAEQVDSNSPRHRRPDVSPHRPSAQKQSDLAMVAGETTSDSGSGRSSVNVYRSRLARGSGLRNEANVTPEQGSTSSFGGTGGSLERGADSGGSGSALWGTGRRFRRESRPENKLPDDDDFLPFAMSDLASVVGGPGLGRDDSGNQR